MARFRLPTTLRPLTGGVGEIAVDGDRLGAALTALEAVHPGFEERLLTDDGALVGFVNVFIDDTECRQLDGLDTVVGPETVITVVPAVAGG
ncbi:MAG: MoaD/ThiS family protein [Actinomycetota bacterium]